MLVLTRNEGQTILIGDDVRVTVVSTKGGQVRFGIQAPRDVTVLREELKDRDVGAGAGTKPAPDGGRG